jgi:hypothetical protein
MKTELSFDAVKHLAADIWEDLGRTRLAGVAVGLALALLAVTVIVVRPSGPPDIRTSYATATATVPEEDVSFTVPGEKPMKLSDVDVSAPRDPFRSLDGLASTGGSQTLLPAGETIRDAISATTAGGGSASGASTTGYDDASSLMPLDDLSTGTGTTPQPAPTDTPKGEVEPADAPREPASAPVTDYSYAVDIQFGRVDDLKRYASVQRLGLVPSKRLPLLMYLGVSTDHTTAVFMVDSRLSQGGEGTCVPKRSLCTFLELQATPEQDEHHFRDADGNEYLLRLRRLVRTTASSGSLSGRDVSALRGTPPVVDGSR